MRITAKSVSYIVFEYMIFTMNVKKRNFWICKNAKTDSEICM